MALHQSGEDYLEAILMLQKEKGMVCSVDGDFFLRLTDLGREVAEQTYEKHCFFTHLLTEAGVDPKTAEQEACCMEHVISENSFRHLKQSMDKKK